MYILERLKTFSMALLLICCLLSGCGNSNGPGPDESAQNVPPEQPLQSLVVAQMNNSIKTAAVVLADKLGYFEEEGLDITFAQISNLNDAAVALTEGKIDVLPYGIIPTCTFASQGADLTVIGGSVTGGSSCVALPENAARYETPEGFRGATVACVRPETGHMYMEALLRERGILPGQDVTFVELDNFQSVTEAVLKGEADAGFVNCFTQTAVKQGLTAVFDIVDYFPDAVCCRQTTSGTVLVEKRNALVKFEIALLRAYRVYLDEPETTVSALTPFSGQDEAYVRTFLYEDALVVSLDPASIRVKEFYEMMADNGDLSVGSPKAPSNLVDASIYREALQILAEREPEEALWQDLQAQFSDLNPT